MPLYRRKPDPFNKKPSNPMNIDEIWKSGQTDDGMKPPAVNMTAMVPYSRLVYNLDHLNDLSWSVPIDSGTANLILKKTPLFPDQNITRKPIVLTLMGRENVFTVNMWIIPVFCDGIIAHHLYAADDLNQQLLRENRSPVKPGTYDIQP